MEKVSLVQVHDLSFQSYIERLFAISWTIFCFVKTRAKNEKWKELRVDEGRASNESSSWDRENLRGTSGSDSPELCQVSSGFAISTMLLRFMQISLESFLSEISNQSVVPTTSSTFEPRFSPYRVSTFILSRSLLTRYLCETSNLEVVKKNEPNLERYF